MRNELERAVSSLFTTSPIANDCARCGGEGAAGSAQATRRTLPERRGARWPHARGGTDSRSRRPGSPRWPLSRILAGISAIGASRADSWRVVSKVALDSLPGLRLRMIHMLAGAAGPLDTTTVAKPCSTHANDAPRIRRRHGSRGCEADVSRAGSRRHLASIRLDPTEAHDAGISFPEMSEEDEEAAGS